jgi:hypothetical protein
LGEFWDEHIKDQQKEHCGQLFSMILNGGRENTEIWNPDPKKTIYSPVFEPGAWRSRPEDLPDEPMEKIDDTVAKVRDESGEPAKFADEKEQEKKQLAAFGIKQEDLDDYKC